MKADRRTHHIGEKYIAAMVLLVVVFFSAIGLFSYKMIETIVTDLYQEMALHTIRYAENILDGDIQKLEKTMRTPLYSSKFITALQSYNAYHSNIQMPLQQMIYDNRFIMRVCVYDTRDNLYHEGEIDNSLIPRYKYNDLLKTSWGKKTLEANGFEIFFDYNVLDASQSVSGDVTSCCKLLRNPANGEAIGFMVVNLNQNFLSSIFMDASIGDYAIVNNIGEGWITDDNCIYSTSAVDKFTSEKHDRMSVVSIKNERTGWSIMSISRKSELTERAGFFFVAQSVFILAMGGLMFIIFSMISRSLTKPIKQLYRLVEDFGRGIYRTDETFENDEIGKIGNKFVDIMKENEKLSENYIEAKLREQEASFRFLQAQINPHFIYNVLDSIYWMSKMKNQSSNVAEMAISLSRILRYSVNKNDDHHTTVARELQLCQHYLQIQNIRYQGKFRVTIDVDDEIMDCTIIKFLLEPFVENAIVHGLEAKPGDGSLKIVGKDLGDEMEFRIEDDGEGVTDPSVFYSGYGITNVIERIKRCYVSENAGCTFTSSPDSGTTVILRVPKEIALSFPSMQRGPL